MQGTNLNTKNHANNNENGDGEESLSKIFEPRIWGKLNNKRRDTIYYRTTIIFFLGLFKSMSRP
jgi:hypothetical protein